MVVIQLILGILSVAVAGRKTKLELDPRFRIKPKLKLKLSGIVHYGTVRVAQLGLGIPQVVTKFFYDERNDKGGAKSYRYEF